MIDRRLRVSKDRFVDPVVARLPHRVTPMMLTAAAAIACVASGVVAAFGHRWWSVGLWLSGRALDGFDGALAVRRGEQSDLGGYLDLLGDTVGYAAVPIGLAAARGQEAAWIAGALLLASFYVNTMSWTFLAAVAEKRRSAPAGQRTTIAMPAGLVEGAETIVFYVAMLSFPGAAVPLFVAMTVLVAVTVVQRVMWAVRWLR